MTTNYEALLTATQQTEALRNRRVTPRDLVDRAIATLESWQPTTNVYSRLWSDDARSNAAAGATEDLPLSGVPVLVKDSFDVRGYPTTGCCEAFAGNIAHTDALLVHRLRTAGAIVIGKANMHELAASGTGHISTCGPIHNPWNPRHLAGGSSGGSAVAVAVGAVPISLGTDTAGSIRVPSSFCGVVGLKPTQHRLSMDGVMPLAPSLGCPGPIARTVDDVALAFGILDESAPPVDLDITRLRFGRVNTGYYGHRVHPGVRTALDAAAETLRAAGMKQVQTTLPGVDEALAVWGDLAWPEFAEAYPNLHLEHVGKQIADHYLYGKALPALRREAARARADVFRHSFLAALEEADVLLLQATPYAAPRFDDDEITVGHGETMNVYRGGPVWFTCALNIAGLPALSLPAGFDDAGLPLGVQLVGKPDDEWTLLAVGAAFQQRTDHHTKLPQLD